MNIISIGSPWLAVLASGINLLMRERVLAGVGWLVVVVMNDEAGGWWLVVGCGFEGINIDYALLASGL